MTTDDEKFEEANARLDVLLAEGSARQLGTQSYLSEEVQRLVAKSDAPGTIHNLIYRPRRVSWRLDVPFNVMPIFLDIEHGPDITIVVARTPRTSWILRKVYWFVNQAAQIDIVVAAWKQRRKILKEMKNGD